ncbi:MAG: 3-phosphoglycerate dehydrogenase, partial [Ruthenibacterium sp.]
NLPGVLAGVTDAAGKAGLNIDNMVNKSKKEYAYTMMDATGTVEESVAATLRSLPEVIRVRII